MSARPMQSIDEIALLRAEVATLRQLLEVLEATALEQTSKLQASVRERTRIAEEMREQLEFTRAVTESMGEGVIAADSRQEVTFANRAAETLLARPRRELMGRKLTEIDLGSSVDQMAMVLESLQTVRTDEDQLVQPDGTRIPVTTTISPIVAAGERNGAILVFHDITSRKEAERQRHLLLEAERAARIEAERAREVARFLADAGSALVASLDYRSTMQRVAALAIPSFADWSFVHLIEDDGTLRRVAVANADPAKAAAVEAVEELYPPSSDDAYGPARVVSTGDPQWIPEITDEILSAAAKDQRHFEKIREFGFTSYLSVPLISPQRTLGCMSFAYAESGRRYRADDILLARQLADRAALALENGRLFADVEDARRTLERRVEERTAQLQEANRELESFSYSVSHDLRAPIRHISGFVEMLTRRSAGGLDPTAAHYLSAISTSAKYAGNLVDDLLAFSRMGRAGMVRAHVRMNDLVEQARNDLGPDIAGRPVDWIIGDLGEATADAAMVRLVWRNLIGNALKYSRPRDRSIVEIGRVDGGSEWHYYIRDNGVGFDMQYVDKLFGVFQRLHRGDQFEGTGIGLANVRRIVLRHGGRVWAEGVLDQGATFWFALPKSREDMSE